MNINIKNIYEDFLNNDIIQAWYKINNNVDVNDDKFSYKNIKFTFLNSIINRFQYKTIIIDDKLDLIDKINLTKKYINDGTKNVDIIVNPYINDTYVYANIDLLVSGKLIGKNENCFYPLFICTYFNKINIEKYVNIDMYKSLGKEYVRIINKNHYNNQFKLDHYIICPFYRWNGNENLLYFKVNKDIMNNDKLSSWLFNIIRNIKIYDLENINVVKPFFSKNKVMSKFEKEVLIKRGDIQLINGIGKVTAKKLYDKGIFSWKNKNFLPTLKVLFNNNNKYKHIKRMVKFSNTKCDNIFKYKENNIKSIKKILNDVKIDFFVDYETFGKMKCQGGINMCYLIGMYVVIYNNKKVINTNFHYFMAEKKCLSEEYNIVHQWKYCMEKYKKVYNITENINIYHWGHMERSYINKINNRHDNHFLDLVDNSKYNYIDLCELLKVNKFIFKDLFIGYSIKDVSNYLYKKKLISMNYDTSECKNGYDSFALGIDYYNQDFTKRQILIDYNKIDCMVIFEILNYLRKNI